jgi:hypothetical protein
MQEWENIGIFPAKNRTVYGILHAMARCEQYGDHLQTHQLSNGISHLLMGYNPSFTNEI